MQRNRKVLALSASLLLLLAAYNYSYAAESDISTGEKTTPEQTAPEQATPEQTAPEDVPTEAPAEPQSSRKGVFLSGTGFFGPEVLNTKRISIRTGLRVGGGVTEDLLLYLEATGSLIDQSTLNDMILFDAQLKGQYYIWEGFYLNVGGGASLGRTHTLTIFVSDTKAGFIISGGAGYEFRFGKKFFLAPEFCLAYRRIADTNYLVPEVGGHIGWHF